MVSLPSLFTTFVQKMYTPETVTFIMSTWKNNCQKYHIICEKITLFNLFIWKNILYRCYRALWIWIWTKYADKAGYHSWTNLDIMKRFIPIYNGLPFAAVKTVLRQHQHDRSRVDFRQRTFSEWWKLFRVFNTFVLLVD